MNIRAAIVESAHTLGFDLVRFASAEPLLDARAAMNDRLRDGHLNGMSWMTESRAELATTPSLLLDGAQSFITLGISYLGACAEPKAEPDLPRGRIARYAWGQDYHDVLRALASDLRADLSRIVGRPVASRIFVDSSPLAERAVAARSGLGWFGKNTMILAPGVGSFTLLVTLLTDLALDPDPPLQKSCGSCRRCIDACPTDAFPRAGVLDATRCISFHTIENRGAIPIEFRAAVGTWVFGCDDCQEVCPVNRRVPQGRLQSLRAAQPDDAFPPLLPILLMDDVTFRARYRRTAIFRTKLRGMQRNACVVLGNIRAPIAVEPLAQLLLNDEVDPIVRGHAAWALGRIGGRAARRSLTTAHARPLSTLTALQRAALQEEVRGALSSVT